MCPERERASEQANKRSSRWTRAGRRTGKRTGPEHVSLFPLPGSSRRLNNCASDRKNPSLCHPIERMRRFDITAKKRGSFTYAILPPFSPSLTLFFSFPRVFPLRNSARSVNLKMFALRELNGVGKQRVVGETVGKGEKGNVVHSLFLSLSFSHSVKKRNFINSSRAVKISLTVGGHHYLPISQVVCEPTRERILH